MAYNNTKKTSPQTLATEPSSSVDELNRNLGILEELSEALTEPSNLEEGLRRIVKLTCRVLDSTQAAVLLMDEEKQRFIVHATVGLDPAIFREGSPLIVPDRLQSILFRLQNIHQINWIDSGLEGIQFPIIVMPLYFKGHRIGHLFAGGANDPSTARDPVRRRLFSLLGPFASLIIENGKAMDLINQRLALRPTELADEEVGDGNQLMINSIRNPAKVVRIFAESFYRELTKAGFNAGHVTIAAAHLLDCIVRKGANLSTTDLN
ncbi:MAG: hypothetical protein J5654_06035 [Victivallales bacterium]|nr:hypothetical protein [Victivallales bacterium]